VKGRGWDAALTGGKVSNLWPSRSEPAQIFFLKVFRLGRDRDRDWFAGYEDGPERGVGRCQDRRDRLDVEGGDVGGLAVRGIAMGAGWHPTGIGFNGLPVAVRTGVTAPGQPAPTT
jgi:hypothetical protein